MAGTERVGRAGYRHFQTITTRWADNDAYGHVNNVVYYLWFDTVVNTWLIEQGLLDIEKSPTINLVVETGCRYFESVTYPEPVEAAMAVERVGNSSVTYLLAVFRKGAELPAAEGRFVHVTVDRETRRPATIPAAMRSALERLLR
jgi:acyl-CoA thioester hydrolase